MGRKIVRHTLLVVAFLAVVTAGAFQVMHRMYSGHFAPLGLHVDAISGPGSIGIPGQTTLYWAELTNVGLWPVPLTACEYVTDAMQRGAEYAYGVQRWDVSAKTWTTVSTPDREAFCQPTPLGRSDTVVRSRYIWPTQTETVMEFEALGAWDQFRKGDIARFVVFRSVGVPIDWGSAVVSGPFQIQDEAIIDAGPFRLRH